jgi:glyoxylase-like metal-dependent hydrolase (beta-lactamase superfamily II)
MTQLAGIDQPSSRAGALEEPVPGLYATAPTPLPFAPSLEVRAFVLQRAHGNVLVYDAPGAEPDRVGTVSRQYLNHRHEAAFGGEPVGVPLFVHTADRDAVARHRRVRASFSARHILDDDLEVIPTPGHTPGATAYLWDSGQHRFLFTGDSIYLDEGEWVAAVLDSSDRAAYLQSLELIRGLDFDVLVPWAATSGNPYHVVTTKADARRNIAAILERVRRGEDS